MSDDMNHVAVTSSVFDFAACRRGVKLPNVLEAKGQSARMALWAENVQDVHL